MKEAGMRAITHSSTGMGTGPSAVRAEIAEKVGAFPLYRFVNGETTNENGTLPLTQYQAAKGEQKAMILIRASKPTTEDCVSKAILKALNLGGKKNLKTMSNSDAINVFGACAHNWGMRPVQPDGYSGKGPKPAGWQYKVQYYEAKEGHVLTQNIGKFDSVLPKENSKPAAKRPRTTKSSLK